MALFNDMQNFYKLVYMTKNGIKHEKTFKSATKSVTTLMQDANKFLKKNGYRAASGGSCGRRIFK